MTLMWNLPAIVIATVIISGIGLFVVLLVVLQGQRTLRQMTQEYDRQLRLDLQQKGVLEDENDLE